MFAVRGVCVHGMSSEAMVVEPGVRRRRRATGGAAVLWGAAVWVWGAGLWGISEAQATFSIVARDPATGELGIAVQSRAFSVGGGVPWAEAGLGAIATQASTNESFGPNGLDLLRGGHAAPAVLDTLLARDEGRDDRQVGIVDANGRSAAFTGGSTLQWSGHHTEANLAVQGNILAGRAVVDEMVRAFQETNGELAERLLSALHAGQAAGGDIRGMQSAALLVVRPSDHYPEYRTRYIDLRVEDHPSPIEELDRVFRIHQAGDLLRAHLRYAEAYRESGDTTAAAREFARIGDTLQRTLQREDAEAGTLNALAWYCATADAYLEESLLAARRAVALEPGNTGILDTLAEVQFRMGRAEEAIATIDAAIALAPDDAYLASQKERFMQGR